MRAPAAVESEPVSRSGKSIRHFGRREKDKKLYIAYYSGVARIFFRGGDAPAT